MMILIVLNFGASFVPENIFHQASFASHYTFIKVSFVSLIKRISAVIYPIPNSVILTLNEPENTWSISTGGSEEN